MRIDPVGEADVGDLLPMLEAYCAYYRVAPDREKLETLVRRLLERPDDGVQLIARDNADEAAGFATLLWTWDTLLADQVGVLHDLYVRPEHRQHGVGRALIYASLELARGRGAAQLAWNTEPGNAVAQRLYNSLPDVESSEWLAYSLDVPSGA